MMNRHRPQLIAISGALLLGLTLLAACGESKRTCLERAECFAGEFCNNQGYCAPYKGRVVTSTNPNNSQAPSADRDQDNPFEPKKDMGDADMFSDLDQDAERDGSL